MTENKVSFSGLRDELATAFVLEFDALEDHEQEAVLLWLRRFDFMGLFQFFTHANIEGVSLALSNEGTLRRFTLSLWERMEILIACSPTIDDSVLTRMTEIVCVARGRYLSDRLAISKDIGATIGMTASSLKTILSNNPWILVLYLTLATGAFANAIQAYAEIKAS